MTWLATVLRCPSCQGKLSGTDARIDCVSCNAQYPVRFGVPLLSEGVKVENREERPSAEFVQEMTKFLGGDEAIQAQVETCFGLRLSFGDEVLQSEADQFLNRLRSSGVSLPEPYGLSPHVPEGVTLGWLILPKAVQKGKVFSLSVVISNGSGQALSSKKEPPFRLSYIWEVDRCRLEGLRTPLLIDLAPGRQISMPIIIQAPDEPGEYRLRVMPIIEGIAWIEAAEITATISVSADEADPLSVDWTQDPQTRGYLEDHSRAVELCREWVQKYISAEEPVLLELGGNFHPMAQYLPGQRYNVDIDAFGLMTYNIKEGLCSASVRNVVANGMNLPFPPDFADSILLFATFHHFPDPVALLRHLTTRIKPGGLLLLMCEPIGHVFHDGAPADFMSELERGVYEQSFMPWEYRAMLAAAGLEIVEAALDPGSLKIAARKPG
ncbi:class I SAM-dependent methyltransferase [Roseomonas xinghualingensis]|uniref:class I SAM-dependent methyltransferase n=1 Tax=Roseomonas xinghualingensis TaxID=2986475 RepID=UPI0021F0F875|nr:class I SAM-dependent methyltransferase [Roseomonas sp. SXEYE001]MCV4207380.1 class I SAM-dependent methyltransferase [Roseomonas sp. SXEYE001]